MVVTERPGEEQPYWRERKAFKLRGLATGDQALWEQEKVRQVTDQGMEESEEIRLAYTSTGEAIQKVDQVYGVCIGGEVVTRDTAVRCSHENHDALLCPAHRRYFDGVYLCPAHAKEEMIRRLSALAILALLIFLGFVVLIKVTL